MFSEFDDRLKADMEVALKRACDQLPANKTEDHEVRRFVAKRIISCARDGRTTLTELTATARRAVIELQAKWG